MNGSSILIGVVFVPLVILVKAYPVRTTVIGLVLYVGGTLLGFVFNPVNLGAAVIVKLLLVAGLVKAVHAAVASERNAFSGRNMRRVRGSDSVGRGCC